MAKINIKALSRAVGVAPSTVSKVLSGQGRKYRIAEKTVEIILAKAAQLDYKPNYFAHSLNTGRTFNIGLVFADSIDAFSGKIMEGVESKLRNTNYLMAVATCENRFDMEQKELERMIYRQVDGIIIYPSAVGFRNTYSTEHLAAAAANNIPVVIIGREVDLAFDHILFADYLAGKQTAEAFLACGCQRFGMVSLPIKCSANRLRQTGFVETLRKNGVAPRRIIVVGNDDTPIERQLERLGKVDCLWGVNLNLVINYVSRLAAIADVSKFKLRSLGDSPCLKIIKLDLFSYAMPVFHMGYTAAALLLERIAGMDCPPRKQYLDWLPAYQNHDLE